MAKLNLGGVRKEQRGADVFVSLLLSEDDGPASVPFNFTLHNVKVGDVDVKKRGMLVRTKEGAPVIINFGKPGEGII